MSLFLTIAGLTLGFIVVCKALLCGVRAIARPTLTDDSAVNQPQFKVSPVRR